MPPNKPPTEIGACKNRIWGQSAPKSVPILMNHPKGSFGGMWFSWTEPIIFTVYAPQKYLGVVHIWVRTGRNGPMSNFVARHYDRCNHRHKGHSSLRQNSTWPVFTCDGPYWRCGGPSNQPHSVSLIYLGSPTPLIILYGQELPFMCSAQFTWAASAQVFRPWTSANGTRVITRTRSSLPGPPTS